MMYTTPAVPPNSPSSRSWSAVSAGQGEEWRLESEGLWSIGDFSRRLAYQEVIHRREDTRLPAGNQSVGRLAQKILDGHASYWRQAEFFQPGQRVARERSSRGQPGQACQRHVPPRQCPPPGRVRMGLRGAIATFDHLEARLAECMESMGRAHQFG